MLLAFSGLWGEDGGLWIVSRIESSLHALCLPDLPRFILLVSFSDTLLVVSILATFAFLKGLIIHVL